jgi:DNA-binding response OmpR family regulator
VYINALRKKLDDQNGKSFIETIRGVGYRINEEA